METAIAMCGLKEIQDSLTFTVYICIALAKAITA